MAVQIDRIRELKTEAKNRRDRGIRGYDRAIALLNEAIDVAQETLKQTTVRELRAQLAVELSDCHGIIGGIERRWATEGPVGSRDEHLRASIRAYDAGYQFESDREYGITNSYNMVNRLIGRLLLRPDLLNTSEPVDLGPNIEKLDVLQELDNAVRVLRDQLAGVRRGDYWALADLGLVQLLLGHTDPATAYAAFNALSPPDFAYTSALAGLRPLAELPMSVSPAIGQAVSLLERHLQRLRS